jgi:hypothetical protein
MITFLRAVKSFNSTSPRNYCQRISASSGKLFFSAVFISILFNASIVRAQINSYTFSTSTGNVMETGAFTNLLGTNLDDNVSSLTNIGFTFKFGGTNYTDFSATSNGILEFGSFATSEYDNAINNLSGPYLAPYWDDNYTDANGNVQYRVQGAAGSRKLIVDYNLSSLSFAGTADKHFQIWLFETSNQVMFVYGSGNNNNQEFSTGILTDGTSDFISITTSSHTASKTTADDANASWPGAGRGYIFTSNITLPVSLLNFSGYKDGNSTQLHWSTATENNNSGFEVQHSTDGIHYTPIGFVRTQAPGGNSSDVLTYSFTENNVTRSRQFYRLRQVDFDSRSKLSNVILINGNKPLTLAIDGLFPNPASTVANVLIATPDKDQVTLFLTDMAGRIIIQKEISADAGSNTMPLDISQLTNGIYMVKVKNGAGVSVSLKLSVNR